MPKMHIQVVLGSISVCSGVHISLIIPTGRGSTMIQYHIEIGEAVKFKFVKYNFILFILILKKL